MLKSNVAIITPSKFEYDCLMNHADFPYSSNVFMTGMGKVRAGLSAREICASFDHVLLTGFCGGIYGVRVGEVLEATRVFEGDYNAEPLEEYPNMVSLVATDQFQICDVITQDRIITNNPYGRFMGRYPLSSKVITEMEAYAVAMACAYENKTLNVVKVVSDVADANASHDFLKACKENVGVLADAVVKAALLIQSGKYGRVSQSVRAGAVS